MLDFITFVAGASAGVKLIDKVADKIVADFFVKVEKAESKEDPAKLIDDARNHMAAAGAIFDQLKSELDQKSVDLDTLAKQVEEKKIEAVHFSNLAGVGEAAFASFRKEMEESVQQSLQTQAKNGRLARITITIVTLIVGAGLGAYFKDLVTWLGIS